MVNIIRRFQQPLMITVTILVIIAFAWLYNDQRFLDKSGGDRIGTIYGRNVSVTQFQRIGRKFELARQLGLMDLLRSLAIQEEGAKENFVWNNFVLKHQAESLGLEPTENEVFTAIQTLPVFQTNGVYDSSKFGFFIKDRLPQIGFTSDDLEDLFRDDLRLKKVKDLLGATTTPSEAEVRQVYTINNQKIEASVVRLKLADFLGAAQVAEDDVKKAYEARKATLKTQEQRKVKYVAFVLPTTDKPLSGKDRVDALTKLSKDAEDFSVAMTEKDAKFDAVAAKAGVKIEETPDFARTSPPAPFTEVMKFPTAAFRLTDKDPISDVVESERGYYVLQLAGVTPARPQTLAEAQPELLEELKHDRAQEALDLKAKEIHNKIEAELKGGKSFVDAATAAGAKADKFPAFSGAEPQVTAENSGEIMQAAAEMKVGQLSAPVPGAEGAVIVYVDQRLPIDEAKFQSEKARLTGAVADFQKGSIFQEWLKLNRAAAKVNTNLKG